MLYSSYVTHGHPTIHRHLPLTTHPSTDIEPTIIADSELDQAKPGAYLPRASASASTYIELHMTDPGVRELATTPRTTTILAWLFHPYTLGMPIISLSAAYRPHPPLLSTHTYAANPTLSFSPSLLRTNPNPSPI